MSDHYSSDCPEPAEHAGTPATPSRLPADASADPKSAAGSMRGFEPRGETLGTIEDQLRQLCAPRPGERCPLTEQIGQAEALLKGVHDNLRAGLAVKLDVVQTVCDEKHSSCAGQVELVCDQAEQCLAKRYRKIEDFLVSKLAHCYNLLARFGIVPPSSEELQARAGSDGRHEQQALAVVQPEPGYPTPQPLQQLPAEPIRKPAFLEARNPPPPAYKKGVDCCEWWILWFEWFWPLFWHWLQGYLHAHGDCIPVKWCDDKAPADIQGWEDIPIYVQVDLPDYG